MKRNKTIIYILIIVLMIACPVGLFVYQKNNLASTETHLKARKNQTLTTAVITEMVGNEMTYTIVKEVDSDEQMKENPNPDEKEDSHIEDGTKEQAETAPNQSQQEQNAMQMPNRETRPEDAQGEVNSDEEPSKTSEASFENTEQTQQMTFYQTTDDTRTAQIPVGTTVTTALGTQSTFSRLAAGNIIEILTEPNEEKEAVIVEIQVVNNASVIQKGGSHAQ